MPSIAADDTAAHGVQLSGAEVVVTIENPARKVTVIVLEAGTEPIYWNARGKQATERGPDCRVIPPGIVVSDSEDGRRLPQPDGPVLTRVHLFCKGTALVSVQRGE